MDELENSSYACYPAPRISGGRLRGAGRGGGHLRGIARGTGDEQLEMPRRLRCENARPFPPAYGRRPLPAWANAARPRAPPLAGLDAVSSPYAEAILDLSDSRRMLLETARGCRFHCKYCYYPKGADPPRFLSPQEILANLSYAAEHGAEEVVLLDPTLNQRPDFIGFLGLLRRGNAARPAAVLGRIAGGRDRRGRRPAVGPGRFSRSRDRSAIGRAAGVGADGPAHQPRGLRGGRPGDARRRDRRPRGPDPRPAGRHGRLDPPRHRLPPQPPPLHRGPGLQPLGPARHGIPPAGRGVGAGVSSLGRPTTHCGRPRSTSSFSAG